MSADETIILLTVCCIALLLLLPVSIALVGRFDGDIFDDNRRNEMLNIRVKYLRDIKPIEFFDEGDWIDLRAGMDIVLEPGGSCVVPLGVAMELPNGYSAIIAPRSSTFKKWGIIQTNSIGIIDESYCGDNDEWGLPVLAFRHTRIHKNDRICQFRLIKQSDYVDFEVVDELGNPDRKGFGSTGEK